MGTAAACAVALLVMAGPASADDVPPPQDAEQVASVVDDVSSSALKTEEVPAKEASDGSFTSAGDVAVTIPSDAAGAVSATTETASGPMTVEVGTGTKNSVPGELAADGSVVYNGSGPTDQTVQPTTDGFRIHTIVEDANAPTEFSHEISLPAGTRMVPEQDMPNAEGVVEGATSGAAVFIVDGAGQIIGGFSSPWAKDAAGADLPTHYEVRGANLVQVVDHRTAGVAYPVVADPYLGFDMIKSAAWEHHTEGWTLKVTPTGWARFNAGGYLPGVAGWNELYAKYRNRGLNTNLDGMRDQFICHQQVVALRAPNKPTWNLDEWRPNVSYLQTVNASCNPGGSKWFD
jgi:hypothetical protein